MLKRYCFHIFFTFLLLVPFSLSIHATTDYYPETYSLDIPIHQFPHQPIPDSDVHVIADVIDNFGEIEDATLSYSTDNGKSWRALQMTLITGTRSNGTFLAIIPSQQLNIFVEYRINFTDNLGYSGFSKGEYTVSKDITSPIFVGEKPGYFPQDPAPWESVTVRANLYDGGSGVKNVTLYYTTDVNQGNYSGVEMYRADGDKWQGLYEGKIPALSADTVTFFVEAHDYAGNHNKEGDRYSVKLQSQKELRVDLDIFELNMQKLQADTGIYVEGYLPSEKHFLHVINVTNSSNDGTITNSFGIHLKNQRFFFNNEEGKPLRTSLSLLGESWLYPFDSYYLDLALVIPLKEVKVDPLPIEVDITKIKNNWNPSHKISLTTKDDTTIQNIHLSFARNFSVFAIKFSLIGIFYLLGATFMLQNSTEQLTNKLAITIGIFAFIFAFAPIIDGLKPFSYGFPTLADMLIFDLILATIGYSVSSIIGTRYLTGKADLAVFIIISTIVSTTLLLYLEVSAWLIPMIVFGLGYGFLIRSEKIRNYLQKYEKRRICKAY